LAVLTVAVVAMSVFAMLFAARPVKALTGLEYMRVDPPVISRKDLRVNDTFPAYIIVGNMTRMTTVACSFMWDPYYLNLTSIVMGGAFPTGGGLLIGDWNSTLGYVSDATYGVLGTYYDIPFGYALNLTFKIMHPGCSAIDIFIMSCWDWDLNEVLSGDCPYDGRVCISEVRTFPIDWNNDTTVEFYVQTESNSTMLTPVYFNTGTDPRWGQLFFNVTGYTGSTGYVNVTIPKALLDFVLPLTNYWVVIDGANATIIPTTSDGTNNFVYLPYSHSDPSIHIWGNEIVPEFPSTPLLFLMLAITAIMLALARKVHKRPLQTT
jgi:hypothetical protein